MAPTDTTHIKALVAERDAAVLCFNWEADHPETREPGYAADDYHRHTRVVWVEAIGAADRAREARAASARRRALRRLRGLLPSRQPWRLSDCYQQEAT